MPAPEANRSFADLLAAMEGRPWLIASLLYGTGLRLMECLRLRIKDVDFVRSEILARDGKGGKDRRTMLPRSLAEPLRREVDRALILHRRDLGASAGLHPDPDELRELLLERQVGQHRTGTFHVVRHYLSLSYRERRGTSPRRGCPS